MTVHVDPVRVDGVLRPDLDWGPVPVSTMAEYLRCTAATVHRRRLAGAFPAEGIKKAGSFHLYIPCVCVGAKVMAK